MLTESQITRSVTTPTGTKFYRDQETRDIADGHTTQIASMNGDLSDIKTALNYPAGTITWFGWKKPVNSSNPEGEPCGNLLRLARMQSILQLGGYMVKNDHTRKKLSPSNHYFYEDGTQVVFTGADGHYQWGWGVDMWYGSWIEDGYEYEVFDDREIQGHPCVKIPIGSVSASGRCAIDRTNLTLVGYISDDARYRGGNNESSWDGTYRSLLGMPVSNIAIATLAAYARKNGSLWFANERVAIFIVGALMRVYFHNANIQAPFVEGVDERGLHHGGLGEGILYDNDMEWAGNRAYNPYWKNSVGIEKGDFTGLISTTISKSDGNSKTVTGIPCFMGLKNWYKSLWVMEEDSLLVCNSNKTQSMYVKKVIDGTAPSLSETNDKVLAGTCPAHASAGWSGIKKTTKAYLSGCPTEDGGTNETYMCDGYYNPAVTDGSVRGSIRLGDVYYGSHAGSCVLGGSRVPSDADAGGGAVLCEFSESFDTELAVPSEE
jgi:hypothetical protein